MVVPLPGKKYSHEVSKLHVDGMSYSNAHGHYDGLDRFFCPDDINNDESCPIDDSVLEIVNEPVDDGDRGMGDEEPVHDQIEGFK